VPLRVNRSKNFADGTERRGYAVSDKFAKVVREYPFASEQTIAILSLSLYTDLVCGYSYARTRSYGSSKFDGLMLPVHSLFSLLLSFSPLSLSLSLSLCLWPSLCIRAKSNYSPIHFALGYLICPRSRDPYKRECLFRRTCSRLQKFGRKNSILPNERQR